MYKSFPPKNDVQDSDSLLSPNQIFPYKIYFLHPFINETIKSSAKSI